MSCRPNNGRMFYFANTHLLQHNVVASLHIYLNINSSSFLSACLNEK